MRTYFFLIVGVSESRLTLETGYLFSSKPFHCKALSALSSEVEAPQAFKVVFVVWLWQQQCTVFGCSETNCFLRIVIFQLPMLIVRLNFLCIDSRIFCIYFKVLTRGYLY